MYQILLLLLLCPLEAMEISRFESTLERGDIKGVKKICDEYPREIRTWIKNAPQEYFDRVLKNAKSGLVLDQENIKLSLISVFTGLIDIKLICKYFNTQDDECKCYFGYGILASTAAMAAAIGYIKYRSNNIRKDLVKKLEIMRKTEGARNCY